LVFLQSNTHAKEREDLLNRIMAEDWYRYQAGNAPAPKGRSLLKLNRSGESEGGD